MRTLAARLVACALLGAGAAQAEPFTIDHLLAQQSLGPVSIDPSQRWLVAPVTAPYRSAPRWDLIDQTRKTITQLRVFDLQSGGPPRAYPATVATLDAWGYTPGPYSPSGDRMAITRARGRFLEIGVLSLADGKAVWTGLYPATDFLGAPVQWRSDGQLLVITKAPGTPDEPVSWQTQARLTERWAATAAGRVGVTVMGSGRYIDQIPDPAAGRLVLVEAATGRGRTLAQGAFIDLAIAPDGRHAAMLAKGRPFAADPKTPAYTTDPRYASRLQLVDLDHETIWTPCADCDVSADLLAWSPSGASLLVWARQDSEPWSAAGYRRIDPARRQVEILRHPAFAGVSQPLSFGRQVAYGDWMGETPLLLGRAAGQKDGDPDWFAWRPVRPLNLTLGLPPGRRRLEAVEHDGVVVGLAGQLWRINAAGHPFALGRASPVAGSGLRVGERLAENNRPDAKAMPLIVPAGPAHRAAAVLADIPREIGVEIPNDESPLLVADKARAVASLRRNAHGVDTLVLHQAGKPARPLATLNAQLAGVDFAKPRPVVHVGRGGQGLKSWLYLPPGHNAGTKLPLLVIPYPGRDLSQAPARFTPPASVLFLNAQLMAAAGYAVLLPDLRVDPAREPAQGLADDILAAVDAAAIAEPDLDAKRLALWGHSYGGWTVLTAATQSPRFKAVIAGAFSADRVSHYGRGGLWSTIAPEEGLSVMESVGWSELGQGRMLAPPWKDPDRYIRNSPLYQADKISAPVMLVMGDLDGGPGQSMAMFAALYRQNKDAVSLMYHGEGHTYFTPANVADLHSRILAFLKDTIGPGS